jgi:uncharacterized membrane protein
MSDNFPNWHQKERVRTRLAGIVLGIALAMLFDGIVLHQLLQWHHMASHLDPVTGLASLQRNTLWDGVFHAGAYVVLLVGLVLLWHVASELEPSRVRQPLVGYMLVGFGGFNMVESIVSHWLLQLHHVRDGVSNWLVYDVAFFLVAGVLVALIGWWIGKSHPP